MNISISDRKELLALILSAEESATELIKDLFSGQHGKKGRPNLKNKGKTSAAKGKVAHNKGVPAKKVPCKHCSREIGVNAIGKHEKACKLNPYRCI